VRIRSDFAADRPDALVEPNRNTADRTDIERVEPPGHGRRNARKFSGMAVALSQNVSNHAASSDRPDAGFSLIELLGVLVVMVSVLGIGLGGFTMALNTVRGDASMNIVLWQLKLARETAINQRRSVEVRFTLPNYISVVRRNIPSGETVISTAVLEHQTEFYAFGSMPDTPDGFGNGGALAFGAATAYMFNSEGQFVDQAGNILNGTVFVGRVNTPMTARALTVFGPTSTIRTYRWNGTAWRH
jgi:type II secretory pathway pseudopilin PulG